MRVRVLYFASLRERAGADCDEIDLPAGASLLDAVASATRLRPGIGALDASIRYARNLELSDTSTLLADGDEVALLPPVSGG